jgi:hypothetical protein
VDRSSKEEGKNGEEVLRRETKCERARNQALQAEPNVF